MKKKVWLAASILLILFGLTGCKGSVPGQQTRAIIQEMNAISKEESSFAALQSTGIKEQIQEQYEEGKTSIQYHLSLNIFDVLGVDASSLVVEDLEYDVRTGNLEEYTLAYMENAQRAIEQYFNEEKDVELTQQELVVRLIKVEDEWKAEISPSEINIVVTNINRNIQTKAREIAETSEGYLQLETIEQMREQLREALGDESYVETVRVEDIQGDAQGYVLTVAYPDPNEIYTKAAESSYAMFQADEEFRVKHFDFETIIKMMQEEIQNALKTSEKMLHATYEKGSSDFIDQIAKERETILNEHLERVNTEFVTLELSMPKTGVLTGTNSGQLIRIKNTTDIFMFENVHIAFYRITGMDVTEEGTLALTAFMQKRESLTIHLPIGNYKVVQIRGATWYGEDVKFGPFGHEDTASTVLEIEDNHEYDLTI